MNKKGLISFFSLFIMIFSAPLLTAEEGTMDTKGATKGVIKGGAAVGMGEGEGSFTFVIDIATQWFDTGIDVKVGDKITIVASSSVSSPPCDGETGCPPYRNPDDIIAKGFAGNGLKALIGKITEGDGGVPFSVGGKLLLTAPGDGRLYLGYNDCEKCFSDNTGAFEVKIGVERP
jgi:hypothetical protein